MNSGYTGREPVFYHPGRGIIDTARKIDGVLRSSIRNETIDQMRQRYPDVVVGTLDEAIMDHENAMKSKPSEITEDAFNAAFEVLPPMNRRRGGGGSSFMMMEMLSGQITTIYVSVKGRFFSFNDACTLPHGEIMKMVFEAYPELQ